VESPVKVSEQEFMEVLTEQAREIAKAILDGGSEAGEDLALDAKVTFCDMVWHSVIRCDILLMSLSVILCDMVGKFLG